jgi:hypothetical protein
MPQRNNVPAQANAVVPQPMVVDAVDQGAQAVNNHSSITLTFSSKDSVSNSGEVNQPFVDHQADNVDEFFESEAVPGPVIVHGNLPALNMENFIQLGEGVQNVMLAYIDAEADIAEEAVNQEAPMINQELVAMQNMELDNNDDGIDNFLEEDNLVEPKVAHLQVGMARTHFIPISGDMQKHYFLEEGMKIWDRYFAPHCPSANSDHNGKIFQIHVSWFNFITLMLVTPEKFNWAKSFLISALWKIISDESAQEESIKFSIPKQCSVQYKPSCSLLDVVENENTTEDDGGFQELGEEPITPLAPRRKRRPNSLLCGV